MAKNGGGDNEIFKKSKKMIETMKSGSGSKKGNGLKITNKMAGPEEEVDPDAAVMQEAEKLAPKKKAPSVAEDSPPRAPRSARSKAAPKSALESASSAAPADSNPARRAQLLEEFKNGAPPAADEFDAPLRRDLPKGGGPQMKVAEPLGMPEGVAPMPEQMPSSLGGLTSLLGGMGAVTAANVAGGMLNPAFTRSAGSPQETQEEATLGAMKPPAAHEGQKMRFDPTGGVKDLPQDVKSNVTNKIMKINAARAPGNHVNPDMSSDSQARAYAEELKRNYPDQIGDE